MEGLFDPQTLKLLLVGQYPDGPIGGLSLTVLMGVPAIFLTTVLGVPLGFARTSPAKWVRIPASAFVEFFRAIPLVMVVFWLWFIPPLFGLEMAGPVTTVLALSIFGSAYVAEIVRGSRRSVSRGQVEAAQAMGLRWRQTVRYVVLPQTLRVAVPMIAGRYVKTMEGTSLAFLIGIQDLTGMGRLANVRLLAPVEVYLLLLFTYFALNQGIILLMDRWERHLFPDRREPPPVPVSSA